MAAPGYPGITPRWTSSAKSGVGTSLTAASRVWFTLSHGILNEVYYPRLDMACTRDMGCIVTDGQALFSEEKRHTHSEIAALKDGVPAYSLQNTCVQGYYRIEKRIVVDPARDVLLQATRFYPLKPPQENYRLYVLLAPHLGNCGRGNTAWTGDYKGASMLFAERGGCALALACSAPWRAASVGYVGISDGWQDLSRHKKLTAFFERAEDGNVALTGEVDLRASESGFVLALGFGGDAAEAGQRALASLQDGFEAALTEYAREWEAWQKTLFSPTGNGHRQGERDLFRISMTVLRTHAAKSAAGGLIASLSIPWGFARGDEDMGGYHLVWPRDLVEAAGGLLAGGAREDALRILHYLQVTQEADGHWPQNMWLNGVPYWSGVQMDETAFPILLVDLAWREGALTEAERERLYPMVRRAAGFLVRNGPVTQEDRWEEDPGYSPFTLAAEVAALLIAAEQAEWAGEPEVALYLRETADAWNGEIEDWTYASGGSLAQQIGVDGFYVRIAPPDAADAASPLQGFVPIKNRPPDESSVPAACIVSPDALALARFGLRAPDDPRILNTIQAIDALLKVETPFGPAWRRYNEDGYGEQAGGAPFDGTGVGRPWPLLTGERGHYELAAGRGEAAERLLQTMAAFANEGGLLPEQIWDSPDIPARELFFGRPSGSAMPLVWAHAEYVKLQRSLQEGHVFDMPAQTVQRYVEQKATSPYAFWRFNHKRRTLPEGKTLRIETLAPAVIHWSADHWQIAQDTPTQDTGLGVHVANLPTMRLPTGAQILFTFYWTQAERWEGTDYALNVGS